MMARTSKYINDFSIASSSNTFFFGFLRSRSGLRKLSENQNQLSLKEVIIEEGDNLFHNSWVAY